MQETWTARAGRTEHRDLNAIVSRLERLMTTPLQELGEAKKMLRREARELFELSLLRLPADYAGMAQGVIWSSGVESMKFFLPTSCVWACRIHCLHLLLVASYVAR